MATSERSLLAEVESSRLARSVALLPEASAVVGVMHEDVKRMDEELASCAVTLCQHPDLLPEYSEEIEAAVVAIRQARKILALAENPTEARGTATSERPDTDVRRSAFVFWCERTGYTDDDPDAPHTEAFYGGYDVALDCMVSRHRPEEYREGMVTVRGHDQAHLGCMGTETWKWLLDHPEMDAPALDLLVAQHRDTQEALADLRGWAAYVYENKQTIPIPNGPAIFRRVDKILRSAALASVRARSET